MEVDVPGFVEHMLRRTRDQIDASGEDQEAAKHEATERQRRKTAGRQPGLGNCAESSD